MERFYIPVFSLYRKILYEYIESFHFMTILYILHFSIDKYLFFFSNILKITYIKTLKNSFTDITRSLFKKKFIMLYFQ